VILANRSGVNAGERFSLGISEESIWLGLHSEILGASEYKPIVLAIPGVRPRLAKYVARIGLFVTPVTSHREWLRYSSVSWFERLSPSPPTPPPLETTKLRPPSAPPLGVFCFWEQKNASAAGTGSAKRQPTFLAAEISLTGGLPRDAGLRRAQCAFPFAQLAPLHQPPTLRPCGPLTPRLACHTGAGCRSHIAFALQIRRAGS
jgi:hypothetical protein